MQNQITRFTLMLFLVACAETKPTPRPSLLDVVGGSGQTAPPPAAAEEIEEVETEQQQQMVGAPKLTLTVVAPEEAVIANHEATFQLSLVRENAEGEVTVTLAPGCFSAAPVKLKANTGSITVLASPSCLPRQSHPLQLRASLGETKSALVALNVLVRAEMGLDRNFNFDGYANATQIADFVATRSQTQDPTSQITYALTTKGTLIGFTSDGSPATFAGNESVSVLDANETAHAIFFRDGELIVVKTVSNTTTRVSHYTLAGAKIAVKEKNYDMIASGTEYLYEARLFGSTLILSGHTGSPADPLPYASWTTIGASAPTKVLTYASFGLTASDEVTITSATQLNARVYFAYAHANALKVAAFSLNNGDADTSFGTAGVLTFNPAGAASEAARSIVAADGSLYFASTVYAGGPAGATSYVTKLHTAGSVDTTFGTNGSASFLTAGSVVGALAANNYAVFTVINDHPSTTSKLTALDLATGSPIEGFGDADGFLAISFGQTKAQVNTCIVSGDSLLVAGLVTINNYSTPAMAKVNL